MLRSTPRRIVQWTFLLAAIAAAIVGSVGFLFAYGAIAIGLLVLWPMLPAKFRARFSHSESN